MVTQLEAGMEKTKAATFAYTSTAFPMLTGTLVTVAGFVPIGLGRVLPANTRSHFLRSLRWHSYSRGSWPFYSRR
jgi:hypothetical protein